MSKEIKDLIKVRVNQWDAVAPMLQSIRDESIKAADTHQSLKNFSGMVLAALPSHPPRTWSGLVDQQRWFRRISS